MPVWACDGSVPGRVLRFKRGEMLDLTLPNQLPAPTTIHWHGIRLPKAMEGVPGLTQAPVAPGERFPCRSTLPGAGTYWYHPHLGTPEQVARGLAGALIVEDDAPPPVDLVQALQRGQRIRLRPVNATHAHIFALSLEGLPAWLIAREGMPAAAAVPREGERLLGRGMRSDFIIDATRPGR